MNFVQKVGNNTLNKIEKLGSFFIFLFNSIKCALTPRWYGKAILKQIMEIGFYSLPVVGLTAIFTGGVLALQTYVGSSKFGTDITIPTIDSLTAS